VPTQIDVSTAAPPEARARMEPGAARSGVRRETISRIERSRVTSIDMTVLEKLATALGVEPGILIVRAPPTATPRARKFTRRR